MDFIQEFFSDINFVNRLKRDLTNLGWDPAHLAKKSGIQEQVILEWISESRHPTRYKINNIVAIIAGGYNRLPKPKNPRDRVGIQRLSAGYFDKFLSAYYRCTNQWGYGDKDRFRWAIEDQKDDGDFSLQVGWTENLFVHPDLSGQAGPGVEFTKSIVGLMEFRSIDWVRFSSEEILRSTIAEGFHCNRPIISAPIVCTDLITLRFVALPRFQSIPDIYGFAVSRNEEMMAGIIQSALDIAKQCWAA